MYFRRFENIPTNILCAYVLEQDIDEQIGFFNAYLYETNQSDDDRVYYMEDFEEIINPVVCANGAYWLTARVYYGDFNPNDGFWYFDGYGNLVSLNPFECGNRLRMLIEDAFNHMEHDEIAEVFSCIGWEEENVIGSINNDVNGVYAELICDVV